MHTIRLGMVALWLLIIGLSSASGQIKYRVGLDADKATYRVYMTSSAAYLNNNARISTAQVTLLVPHGTSSSQFTVSNLMGKQIGSDQMTWSLNARVNAPTENPSVDYLSFGFSGSASPVLFDIPANGEIELFSFKNVGTCLGIVSLFENDTDPFRTPNSRNTNPGNQITTLGHGPGNAYIGNYGGSVSCKDTALPDLAVTLTGASTATVGSTTSYTLNMSNVGAAATTGVITTSLTLASGLAYTGFTGTGWSVSSSSQSDGTTLLTAVYSSTLSVSASSVPLQIQLTPAASLAGSTALIQGMATTAGETNLNNNSVSQTVTVSASGVSDLSIGVTGPTSLSSGAGGTVVLTVTNVGTALYAGGTTIKTVLPTGLTFTNSSGTGWSCNGSAQGNGTLVSCSSSLSVSVVGVLPALQLAVVGQNTGSASVQIPVSGSLVVATGTDNPANNSFNWPITVKPTVPVSVTADLSTTVKLSNSTPSQYDKVQAIIVVTNQGPGSATGVSSQISLPAGNPVFSYTTSVGTFSTSSGLWTIGTIDPGQSVTLVVTLSANAEGVFYVSNEIASSGQYDPDSTPNNQVNGEDDQAQACFSVPVYLCPGQVVETSIPSNLTNIQWYRNGQPIAQATSSTLSITQEGTYSVTTQVNCPAGGCCPIIVRMRPEGTCCQPVQCVPFVVKKTK